MNQPLIVIFLVIIAFCIGLAIVILSIPPIIRVSNAKHLFDPIDDRKVHTKPIPPLGGVAIFLGFILSTIVATDGYTFDVLKYIVASVTIMFFIGLKDDLLVISARKKFVVQVFASLLLIILGQVHISNLHGIFGIYEINQALSILLSLFVMLTIVNAYNLIDGIDGLASGLAILGSAAFGVWFFLAGQVQFAIMSFALTGSLAGFFIFNVFGDKNKLFMGDAGALVIGLVISTLAIKFNEFNILNTTRFAIGASPVVSFAIVSVPLIDTLRVIIIRKLNGDSPFVADRNHTHHRLLELIPNHFKVTLIMVGANVLMIGLALGLNHISLNINIQLVLVLLTSICLSQVPSVILKIRNPKIKFQSNPLSWLFF